MEPPSGGTLSTQSIIYLHPLATQTGAAWEGCQKKIAVHFLVWQFFFGLTSSLYFGYFVAFNFFGCFSIRQLFGVFATWEGLQCLLSAPLHPNVSTADAFDQQTVCLFASPCLSSHWNVVRSVAGAGAVVVVVLSPTWWMDLILIVLLQTSPPPPAGPSKWIHQEIEIEPGFFAIMATTLK